MWHLRSQVLAIALVIGSGVAVLIMALSTQRGLLRSATAYNERYAFADVFASLERAPHFVASRIAEIPGVQTVQTRIVHFATLDMPGFAEPVTGKIVSIPERGEPVLNKLVLRAGRWVDPARPEEVLLNEPFAQAHGLRMGDEFVALLNGHRRSLRVVGTALCPEYVYSLAPGALMADDSRFGVFWMGRNAMEAAFDLEGAFNDVALRLSRGTRADDVILSLDRSLERYGGVGAISSANQPSNWIVMNEIAQQGAMARILPVMFLIVSAMLTNTLMGRLIASERKQIGLMKAFGYSNAEVSWHYTKFVLAVGVIGVVFGALGGVWASRVNLDLYAKSFRFPIVIYDWSLSALLIASGLSMVSVFLATVGAVRRAALLLPAEAMMPPSPPMFHKGRLGLTRAAQWLDQPTRIILRQIARTPLRSASTVVGSAAALGLLIMAFQWFDAIDVMAESFFYDAQHQHVTVALTTAKASSAVREFERLPGVVGVEPMRIVSADFTFGRASHRGSITGLVNDAQLQPIYDSHTATIIEPPAEGLVVAKRLADKLGARVGDLVGVKLLDRRQTRVELPIVRLMDTYIGMPAYTHLDALNGFLRERSSVQFVNLLIDTDQERALYEELKALPAVSAVTLRKAAVDSFHSSIAENLLVSVSMFSAFACILGFGVIYNSARIALSERGRDLATLRVLGFTRGEVAYILLGEATLLVVVGLPLGCLLGRYMTTVIARAFDTEFFRMPMVIEPSTYGVATLIVIATMGLSAVIIGRELSQLGLIAVLKTRE